MFQSFHQFLYSSLWFSTFASDLRFWLTISRLNFVSGATVFEIKGASIRRLCQWLSGMINILSLNELSPVLMRFSSPRYQEEEDWFSSRGTCQAVHAANAMAWKVEWEGGKIHSICWKEIIMLINQGFHLWNTFVFPAILTWYNWHTETQHLWKFWVHPKLHLLSCQEFCGHDNHPRPQHQLPR